MHTVHAVRRAAYAFRLCPVCRAAFRAACGGIGAAASVRNGGGLCACETAQNKKSTHKRRGGVLCAACGLWRRSVRFACGLWHRRRHRRRPVCCVPFRNGGGLCACVPFPFCGLCCVPFRNGGGLCACAFGVSPVAAASVRPVHFARRRHGQRNGGGVPLFRLNSQRLIGVPFQ